MLLKQYYAIDIEYTHTIAFYLTRQGIHLSSGLYNGHNSRLSYHTFNWVMVF